MSAVRDSEDVLGGGRDNAAGHAVRVAATAHSGGAHAPRGNREDQPGPSGMKSSAAGCRLGDQGALGAVGRGMVAALEGNPLSLSEGEFEEDDEPSGDPAAGEDREMAGGTEHPLQPGKLPVGLFDLHVTFVPGSMVVVSRGVLAARKPPAGGVSRGNGHGIGMPRSITDLGRLFASLRDIFGHLDSSAGRGFPTVAWVSPALPVTAGVGVAKSQCLGATLMPDVPSQAMMTPTLVEIPATVAASDRAPSVQGSGDAADGTRNTADKEMDFI